MYVQYVEYVQIKHFRWITIVLVNFLLCILRSNVHAIPKQTD